MKTKTKDQEAHSEVLLACEELAEAQDELKTDMEFIKTAAKYAAGLVPVTDSASILDAWRLIEKRVTKMSLNSSVAIDAATRLQRLTNE
jgi:hypothetical protein